MGARMLPPPLPPAALYLPQDEASSCERGSLSHPGPPPPFFPGPLCNNGPQRQGSGVQGTHLFNVEVGAGTCFIEVHAILLGQLQEKNIPERESVREGRCPQQRPVLLPWLSQSMLNCDNFSQQVMSQKPLCRKGPAKNGEDAPQSPARTPSRHTPACGMHTSHIRRQRSPQSCAGCGINEKMRLWGQTDPDVNANAPLSSYTTLDKLRTCHLLKGDEGISQPRSGND